jgi:hypothetical protein
MFRVGRLSLIGFVLIVSVILTGCSGSANNPEVHGKNYEMAQMSDMPMDVQRASVTVQQAYQFAVANPDVLTRIPCYCGCGGMGHTSNYACYLRPDDGYGRLVFDNHALGCSICVDITQDAMRMLDQGQSVSAIRTYVDQTYSRFGPTNMP